MKDTKQQWFKDAKFGLFIHWGLYAIPAGEYKGKITHTAAEWIMNTFDIPVDEYKQLAKEFNPVHFDAEYIVKKAKDWGMKYIVFTSKHHDGFAMYHSKCSNYNIVDATPYKKDILKELQLACEKHGIKLGLYYSQAQDWEDPNGLMAGKDNSKKDYQYYLDHKVKPQLREILTNYGDIALIWFDTPMESTEEQSKSLYDLVKSILPNCIVSGRIGNNIGEYMTTGDNYIPKLSYEGDWEIPATLNDTWGFKKADHNWKSANDIIKILLKIVSRGGNYLLNIGPDALGDVPKESIDILDTVGKYVKENEEAIFASKRVAFYPYDLQWGDFTQKDYKLYIHVLTYKNFIEISKMKNKVKGAYLVRDKRKLEAYSLIGCEGEGVVEIKLPEDLRKEKNYCICVELEEKEPVFEALV